ncbi:hypothetical protein [Mycobacterium sp. OTB74]|jgi:hypothetical protein|uniref:hypothetical protein n=1 Tax=Mycobacterium sp. OTB74 TaxID=1853452 RepID=UPI002472FA75|nr:hypothetical protein [Mycobacterium sp. OTB74]MDH6245176.1 hypothetical protein [Mycobacterium sp. OTB74]
MSTQDDREHEELIDELRRLQEPGPVDQIATGLVVGYLGFWLLWWRLLMCAVRVAVLGLLVLAVVALAARLVQLL